MEPQLFAAYKAGVNITLCDTYLFQLTIYSLTPGCEVHMEYGGGWL